MRVLAHISDLHFGRTDPVVVEALLADLTKLRPDVIVVSGDLTQRAKHHQFTEARHFLERLPAPALVVPGNHDLVPVHRPFSRFFRPRSRFRHHLPGHADWPIWTDSEMVVVGLDSTRKARWKTGRLRPRHLDQVDEAVAAAPADCARIAFLHHPPSDGLGGFPFESLIGRGVDLVLAGHSHRTRIELMQGEDSSCVLVQATTACSTRLREEANGFGIIRLDPDNHSLAVELRGWDGHAFHPIRHEHYVKAGTYWTQAA